MSEAKLILRKEGQENEIVFDSNYNIVEDTSLLKELSTENIRNEDSLYHIKSANDIHISDVIQIKVNVQKSAVLLVSFNKETFTEDLRKQIFDEIIALKTTGTQTAESQTEKIKKVLEIVGKFNPIYVVYKQDGQIIPDSEKFKEVEINYPLLVLKYPPKKPLIDVEKLKKLNFFKKIHFNPTYFSTDFLFITIFAIILSFSFICGMHEALNGGNLSVFLFLLAAVGFGILCYVDYCVVSERNMHKNYKFKFFMCFYALLGVALGTAIGSIIDIFVLNNNNKVFFPLPCLASTIPTCLILSILPLFLTRMFEKIVKMFKKQK